LLFPKWHVGDGETGKITLNEWLLSGARVASRNDRVWAIADRQLCGELNQKATFEVARCLPDFRHSFTSMLQPLLPSLWGSSGSNAAKPSISPVYDLLLGC
jgi:hypothetical protein